MRLRLMMVVALVLGVLGATASAQERPTFEDRCGEITKTDRELVAPWNDICGGHLRVTAGRGAPEIAIELTVAGDLAARTDSHYSVSWTAGGCRVRAVHADGFGGVRYGPLVASFATGGWVDVDCDDVRTRYPLAADVVAFEGRTVRWDLPLLGDLADLAMLHEAGSVLTGTRADAGPDLLLMHHSSGDSCVDEWCTEYIADSVRGADVVVAGGDT